MVSKIKTVVAESAALNNEQETAIQSTIADQAMMASYDVLKRVGRIEGMDFLARVQDLAIAKTFEEIKNSKEYRNLPYKDKDGNLAHVQSLEEFCQVFLGKSYNRCFKLAQNLTLLGEELYEQAEQIGFTARDYQALKALPADEQEIVKQAIETEDKEHVIDLLQEMAVKHKSEKDKLTKSLEDKTASYESLSKMNDKQYKELKKVTEELEITRKAIKDMSPVEVATALKADVLLGLEMVQGSINGTLRKLFEALTEHQEETGVDHSAFIAGMFFQVKKDLNLLAAEFDIPDQLDGDSLAGWLADDSEAAVKEALGIED